MAGLFRKLTDAVVNIAKGHDIRPYAHKIVRHTLRQADEARATGKPLILLLGENHAIPAHHLIQMLVLKNLAEAGRRIAFGIEQPHNTLIKSYHAVSFGLLQETQALAGHASRCDAAGTHSLKSVMGTGFFSCADISKKTLLKFVLDQKISSRFNDAASLISPVPANPHRSILDFSDDLTRLAAAKAGRDAESCIEMHEPPAMHIRNVAIAGRALDHMRSSGAEIYIQNCGAFHAAGGKMGAYISPYAQSLSAIFKGAGAAVVAAPLFSSKFHARLLPDDFDPAPGEMIGDLIPPDGIYYYEMLDVEKTQEEREYLRKLLQESGFDPERRLFTAADRVRFNDETQRLYMAWDKKFLLPPPANDMAGNKMPRRVPGFE